MENLAKEVRLELDGRIVDVHVHIFPEKIAAKAVAATGNYYGIGMSRGGTVAEAREGLKNAGIARAVVHSTATRPDQVEAVNDFIADACAKYADFVGFGTLHPYMEGLEREVERIRALGLKGVKVHADFQNFKIDELRVRHMYRALGDLPLLMHMGDAKTENTTPERLANLIEMFPSLTVIGAHFGGYSVWDRAAKVLKGSGIYVDTSSSLMFISPGKTRELIDVFGADRCLFGSDFPMWDQAEELERFDRIPLSPDEREKILWKNANCLLGLGL